MLFSLGKPERPKVAPPYVGNKNACGLELAKQFSAYAEETKTSSPAVSEVWLDASTSLKRRYSDGVTTNYDRSAVMAALRLMHTLEISPCTREQAISAQRFIIEEFSLTNLTKTKHERSN